MQSDLAALSLQVVAGSALIPNGGGGASASQGLLIGQQLLWQLRQTKPVGRLVVNVEGAYKGPANGPYDILLKDGDKLVVPKTYAGRHGPGRGDIVPLRMSSQAGLTRDDYIQKSGGITQHADRKRIYVVRANGDVVSGNRSGWFRRSQRTDMRPGDTIVVPWTRRRFHGCRCVAAVTTIIYNLAIGYILVHQDL